jgi:calmodulin
MIQVSGEVGCPSPSDSDVSEVMKELDANGDGKISLDEFEVLIRQVLTLMTIYFRLKSNTI